MLEAENLSVPLRADADPVAGFRPIGRDGEALIARGDQLYRSVQRLGGKRDQTRSRRQLRLAPECAAHEGTDGANVLRLDPEFACGVVLQPVHELAWFIDRQ